MTTRRVTYWVCYRQKNGRKCLTKNPSRKQLCEGCGKPKPVKRKAKHMVGLEQDYSAYIRLSGADRCGICLRSRTDGDRKFDRDHSHATGAPRGLLCHRCNRALPFWVTAEWLDAAAEYLRRAA